MKKNQILAGLFLAGITLGACTDDYTDWANPQSNSPEEAAAKYEISFAAGADAVIDMDKFYRNSCSIFIEFRGGFNQGEQYKYQWGNHQCCIQDREYSEGEYS